MRARDARTRVRGRIVPGGTAERLLRGAPCSVAIASRGFGASRESEWHPLGEAPEDAGVRRVIGVVYDGSAEAGDALQAASELATRNRAALRVFAVTTPTAHKLIKAAEKGVDLLVLGSRDAGLLKRALLGSVSAEVLSSAPCPVLIAPGGAGSHSSALS